MRTCSHLGSETECGFLGQGGYGYDNRCSGSAHVKSQVLIQRPSLDGLSQAGPCKDTAVKGGGPGPVKRNCIQGKRNLNSRNSVRAAAGFPLVSVAMGAVLDLHPTLTQTPTPPTGLPIADPAVPLPSCVPEPLCTTIPPTARYSVEGTRISSRGTSSLPPRVG